MELAQRKHLVGETWRKQRSRPLASCTLSCYLNRLFILSLGNCNIMKGWRLDYISHLVNKITGEPSPKVFYFSICFTCSI